MYIKLKNGTPETYSIAALRQDNPQVSFPQVIPDATLAEYDVFPCTPVQYPGADYLHNVQEGPAALIDGAWTQTWRITDASAEEITQRTANEAAAVREQRNIKLSASDWTQVADAPVNSLAWANYRQALRDLPGQPGFPWDVIWPSEPT